jgi:uncharacterized metal-binding protein
MAGVRVHDRLIVITAVAVTVIACVNDISWGLALTLGVSEFLGGYFLSPDLDTVSAVYYRWGVLRFWWKPYRKIFHHRSFLSHDPVCGTFFRLIWLSPFWVPLFLFRWPDPIYAVAVVVGIEISAIVHWITDLVTTLNNYFFAR